jgi:hypothetical protein
MTRIATPPSSGGAPEMRVRDLATDKGTWTIRQTTVGEYLTRLGIYDPDKRVVHEENIPDSDYQRPKIGISKNPIKKRMLRDLLRGGTLPAIVTVERQDSGTEIADGLQRTHVLTEAAKGLLALERGEEPGKIVRAQLKEMEDQNQKPLHVDQFLAQPLTEQVWSDLRSDEQLRLFMVLNVGQQKVSPRHLLEVAQNNLRATFQDWGIQLLTEREEKELPRRTRKNSPPAIIPAVTHYRYELLIDGLKAYVTGDPHVKTRPVLEEEGLNDTLSARIMEVGSEACREDFQWTCLQLNRMVREKYEGKAKWHLAVQTSDNFLIPLFAALGKARETADTGSTVQHHQQELLELLDQPAEDPLVLYSGANSLESIQNTIRSNIGRRQRAIAFFAWRDFFRKGPSSPDYPLSWSDGAIA